MELWSSLWDLLWFLFVVYAFLVVTVGLLGVILDLFGDRALAGWVKALWFLCLVVFPVVSLLAYLIARGGGMADRRERQARARQDVQSAHRRAVAGGSVGDEITSARALLAAGTITSAEYSRITQRTVSG